ncbi:3-phosphoshikimate 1-carboxyvinyltransferase [Candidatus Woesearchaeota archaeon]|nr:3-phosphoshikimate 1-carboxyvinyltransferase [Candidatus Woesearchaeota archaeon]|tara:strand:- start:5911 stop:7164 length:1254 start_codon:yes stop_codon:yes gene_type:complete
MIELNSIKNLDAEIIVPGSKYVANRLLIICALADGTSVLRNMPENDDINNAIAALSNFGVEIKKNNDELTIHGNKLISPNNEINVGDSGTLLRFITGFASLVNGNVNITGSKRIKERPIIDLLKSLNDLGVKSRSLNGECPPVVIEGGNFKGGTTKISGEKSSQFISSLLLVAPYAQNDVEIIVETDLVSKGYVDLTIDLMKKFGVNVERQDYRQFKVKAGQKYRAMEFNVPADFSSANYFFAAAAIVPGKVKIKNLDAELTQPEAKFVEILESMGCKINKNNESLELIGPSTLRGIEADMSSMPDSVQTLAVVALFAEGTTKITNVGHLKYKESDRINDTAKELKKLNADINVEADKLVIKKSELKPNTIDPHNDHRMAMSFALIGLKVSGIKIENPECVNKSFPKFWDTLRNIGD